MTLLTRHRLTFQIALVAFIAILPLLSCKGDLLFSENFSYTNGSLTVSAAGLWTTHSGTPGETQVQAERLRLAAVNGEDLGAFLPGGPYTSSTNVILYWSFRLIVDNLPSNNGTYFAHLNITSARSRVFISTDNSAPGRYRVALANSSSSPNVSAPVDLEMNSEHVILVAYDPVTGVSTFWLDPAAETDMGLIAVDSAGPISVTRIATRQAAGIGSLRMDDIRVGTTWADVFMTANPAAPRIVLSPGDQTVSAGQTVILTGAADGTEPIAYQWLREGSVIASGTNSTLVMMGVQTNASGLYTLMASNVAGIAVSQPALVTVNPQEPWDGVLRVVTWNVKGNGATNWSISSPQVQAIGRQLGYMAPDVITFNEIPVGLTYQMTNWIAAFLPGYYLATNSGSDGFIRSVIASRHPIISSSKHLDGVNLAPFGIGNFTRDLFQARIRVPGFVRPLDVFTTHLKATTSSPQPDAEKRAAEAKAISNFIAHVYLPTNKAAPYLLTGDLNEDVTRPDASRYTSGLPIQNLVNPETGLTLTTPINPITQQEFTLSIQTTLNVRFDYILPCALLASNIVSAQVFRSDVLTNPIPGEIHIDDSRSASDHLAVMLDFASPYPALRPILRDGPTTTLTWESSPGERFRVASSPDLLAPAASWTMSEEILADSYRTTVSILSSEPMEFYRIELAP